MIINCSWIICCHTILKEVNISWKSIFKLLAVESLKIDKCYTTVLLSPTKMLSSCNRMLSQNIKMCGSVTNSLNLPCLHNQFQHENDINKLFFSLNSIFVEAFRCCIRCFKQEHKKMRVLCHRFTKTNYKSIHMINKH